LLIGQAKIMIELRKQQQLEKQAADLSDEATKCQA